MLLDFGVGESRIRANGAIIHQGTAGDDFASMRNRDVRIVKAVVRSQMAYAQLRHLARSTRSWILVTFPAGLSVVEGPKAIAYTFSFLKLGLISLMGVVIHHAVALVIESGRCFRILWTSGRKRHTEKGDSQQVFHGFHPFLANARRIVKIPPVTAGHQH